VGAAKRLGKRWASGTFGSGTSERGSLRAGSGNLGVGDRTVAMVASTMGSGRGAAGMSSKIMCSPRSCPRCW